MIGQSIAIIALILVMSFMFLRAGKRAGALFALPLISESLFHLLGFAVHRVFVERALATTGLHIAMDIAGFIVGLCLSWILSRAIDVKKLRYTYFAGCAVFLASLAAAYINYHI